MWSCKEIPTFWSSLVLSSLDFKGHFGPENGGSIFLQNLVSPARLHSFTPQKTGLNFEVRYTVTKELIFTANVICTIPPVTERSKWRQHIVLFKIVACVEPDMLLLFLILCSVLRTALVSY